MAEIIQASFGAEDLQKSLDEIRFFLNLPDGPGTSEEIAEFRRFRLFAESGPYVRLMKLAKPVADILGKIGTEQDIAADDPARQSALKIVKRWTLTKLWEQHPPEQSFQVTFLADDVLNRPSVHRTKKTPRAKKEEQEAPANG